MKQNDNFIIGNRKLISKLIIVLILITLIPAFLFLSDANPVSGLLANTASPPVRTDNKPSNGALQKSSFLMIDTNGESVILSQNEDLRRAPASTVKLLTGMVALEKLKETDLVQVGQEVIGIDGSIIGLQPGDKILVKELLKALYVESANDAAVVLAVACGSYDSFIKEMNQKAETLGCTDSNFRTPNGLPAPEQYSSARDLMRIALTFIKNEQLMKYVQLKETTIEWMKANNQKYVVKAHNTNELLDVYPGDIGLKTGTTTEARQCLISYVKRPDGTILLALLGSNERYTESMALLDRGITMQRSRAALKNLAGNSDSLIKSPGFFIP